MDPRSVAVSCFPALSAVPACFSGFNVNSTEISWGFFRDRHLFSKLVKRCLSPFLLLLGYVVATDGQFLYLLSSENLGDICVMDIVVE